MTDRALVVRVDVENEAVRRAADRIVALMAENDRLRRELAALRVALDTPAFLQARLAALAPEALADGWARCRRCQVPYQPPSAGKRGGRVLYCEECRREGDGLYSRQYRRNRRLALVRGA